MIDWRNSSRDAGASGGFLGRRGREVGTGDITAAGETGKGRRTAGEDMMLVWSYVAFWGSTGKTSAGLRDSRQGRDGKGEKVDWEYPGSWRREVGSRAVAGAAVGLERQQLRVGEKERGSGSGMRGAGKW